MNSNRNRQNDPYHDPFMDRLVEYKKAGGKNVLVQWELARALSELMVLGWQHKRTRYSRGDSYIRVRDSRHTKCLTLLRIKDPKFYMIPYCEVEKRIDIEKDKNLFRCSDTLRPVRVWIPKDKENQTKDI